MLRFIRKLNLALLLGHLYICTHSRLPEDGLSVSRHVEDIVKIRILVLQRCILLVYIIRLQMRIYVSKHAQRARARARAHTHTPTHTHHARTYAHTHTHTHTHTHSPTHVTEEVTMYRTTFHGNV